MENRDYAVELIRNWELYNNAYIANRDYGKDTDFEKAAEFRNERDKYAERIAEIADLLCDYGIGFSKVQDGTKAEIASMLPIYTTMHVLRNLTANFGEAPDVELLRLQKDETIIDKIIDITNFYRGNAERTEPQRSIAMKIREMELDPFIELKKDMEKAAPYMPLSKYELSFYREVYEKGIEGIQEGKDILNYPIPDGVKVEIDEKEHNQELFFNYLAALKNAPGAYDARTAPAVTNENAADVVKDAEDTSKEIEAEEKPEQYIQSYAEMYTEYKERVLDPQHERAVNAAVNGRDAFEGLAEFVQKAVKKAGKAIEDLTQ